MSITRKILPIKERLLTAVLHFILIISGGYCLSGSFDFLSNSSNPYNVIFNAYALLYVLNEYITEPYFTKPIDIIAKTISIFLILLAIDDKSKFLFYWDFFYINLSLFISAIIIIFLQQNSKLEKVQKILYKIITFLAKPSVIGSALYLLALFSNFEVKNIAFTILFGMWILLVFQSPNPIEKFSHWILNLWTFLTTTQLQQKPLGEAIGYDNPFLYKVEVDFSRHNDTTSSKGMLVYLELDNTRGMVGIIFNEKYLLNKRWLSVYVLRDSNGEPLILNLATQKFITETNTIFSKNNQVFILDFENLDSEEKSQITNNYLYKNKDNFIGYISKDSNINKIKFHLLLDESNENHSVIGEGTILFSNIFQTETLFQILDGITTEEKLENHDVYGYTVAIAKKLGQYKIAEKQLETVKWLPEIYTPVFLFNDDNTNLDTNNDIGQLPNTKYGIPIKDYHALVTHNTAILGILGIGKSRLTFELIQKIIHYTDVKVICIDITNQYAKELKQYFDELKIGYDLSNLGRKYLKKSSTRSGNKAIPSAWGNEAIYKKKISNRIKALSRSEKRILILNPDWHKVTKARSTFNIEYTDDLTVTEKTRIIAEEVFLHAMKQGETDVAKFLLVFEEAHSLIPEWNSTANTGDQTASNGTSKVILQGRKYGLGSFVVTQRTANISKSILNQCNTIFALRVFDDTGKQFLENYIGSDYANTLPTLEERHAIVVGKALKLRQPIIIKLNDMENIVINTASTEVPPTPPTTPAE